MRLMNGHHRRIAGILKRGAAWADERIRRHSGASIVVGGRDNVGERFGALTLAFTDIVLDPKIEQFQPPIAWQVGDDLAAHEHGSLVPDHALPLVSVDPSGSDLHPSMDETDPMSSPMKAKGIGELGICGVAAAVANAVYNATRRPCSQYPITLDKLLDRMPEIG
jgi:hypothetical protein